MNREIKFRAWDLIDEKFIYFELGDCFNLMNDKPILPREGDDFIIQQFTGLLDRNKKPIYEGDIVRVLVKNSFITQIVWELCGLRLKDTTLGNMNEGWGKDLEVLGNIFENPNY